MKIRKGFLFNRSYIINEISIIQSKDRNTGLYRINKISLLLTMLKIYKMVIVSCYVFLKPLLKYIKNHFVEYRQFI